MEASKAEIKGVGHKLADEDESGNSKDMTSELANLNKLANKKEMPVITILEKDIKLLQNELDFTFEEAKLALIQKEGDVKKVIDAFLEDFNMDQ